jgi:hypothetical protein
MKLAFKVLLLAVLIIIGKIEKQNQSTSKPSKSLYSPVYSQNTNYGVNQKRTQEAEIQKISLKYNNY